jgi:hypothetical protein
MLLEMDLTETQLEELYEWIDSIPISRKKRNLARDFSDGVLCAEVVHHFYPDLVDLHNYDQGLRVDTKVYNWKILNSKALKSLNITLGTEAILGLANAQPGWIERVLWSFKCASSKVKQQPQQYFEDALPASPPPSSPPIRKLLLEKIQECEEQAEYVAALESKISKLEELMKLKDAKIAKLTARRSNG